MGVLKIGVPYLGFCGYSGSGKTTILEKLASKLNGMGLEVGYLKHDAHKLHVDREGKDTQRLFVSGAGALAATSPSENFTRSKRTGGGGVDASIFSLCDIVLVEGYKNATWDKLWVHPHSGGKDDIPPLDNLIGEVGNGKEMKHGDIDRMAEFTLNWLHKRILKKPLYGGLLVGGQSRRMGSPKTKLPLGETTFAEKQHSLLMEKCGRVYILGNAPLPNSLLNSERISDPPHVDVKGPIAGLISASRFAPEADWLILAVDLPDVDGDYLDKLLERRKPGFRLIAAENPVKKRCEALCALYSSQLLHGIVASFDGELSVNSVLGRLGIEGDPSLYEEKKLGNVNTPQDLKQ